MSFRDKFPQYLFFRRWLVIPSWRVGINEHLCDYMCCACVSYYTVASIQLASDNKRRLLLSMGDHLKI